MEAILKSVILPQQAVAPVGRNMRALAAGDACAISSPLSIADESFDSTGCYLVTPFDGDLSGYIYTATGVEPTENGTGWNQRITFGMWEPQSALPTSAYQYYGITDDDYTGDCEVFSWKADGICDWGNNNAGCEFDGGDCCECTCMDGDYNCSDGFFDCVDPSAPCVNDDDHSYGQNASECEVADWKADGVCDWGNNNAGCDFDGGDCCECTCVEGDYYNCDDGTFNCVDPSAPCVNDDDHSYGDTANECEVADWKADGICDWGNNNAGCEFDGGDCCECTCVDGDYNCGDGFFDCVDPSAPCVNDDDHNYGDYANECEVPSWKADGICDWGNNNAGCEFDGGDCCECTCVAGDYNCDDGFFNCVDPSAPCVNDDDHTYGGYTYGGYTYDDIVSPGPSPSSTEMFWINTYLPPFNGEPLELAQITYICRSSNVEIGTHPADAASWSCATLNEGSSGSDAEFEDLSDSLFSAHCGCSADVASALYRGDPRKRVPTGDNSTTAAIGDSSSTSSSPSSSGCEDFSRKADGECNAGNNNADCDYDGGDCCECTCVDTVEYTCEDFHCVDPSAPCVDDDVSDGDDLVETEDAMASTQTEDSSATKMTTTSVFFVFATMLIAATVSVVFAL